MTAIVVEDEPLARSHLTRMLRALDVEIVGEGKSGVDALNLCETVGADVLFLDIQMPDLTGLQAAAAISHMVSPPILIFVTGFSEYAPKAFEFAAFDYLLKPVEPDRLALALTRARKRLADKRHAASVEIKGRDLAPAQRLPVRTDYAVKLIRVDQIDYATAREKKVFLRVGEEEHKTYYTLVQLENLLPPHEFMRIHASAIVRLSRIEAVNFLGNHTYSVTLSDGAVLPVGRTFYPELQRRLGIEGG
jgi:two-component system LytT family response regulator